MSYLQVSYEFSKKCYDLLHFKFPSWPLWKIAFTNIKFMQKYHNITALHLSSTNVNPKMDVNDYHTSTKHKKYYKGALIWNMFLTFL